jgi:hypothetical protein
MRRDFGQNYSDDHKKPRFGGSGGGGGGGRGAPPSRGGYPQRGGFDGPKRPFRGEGSERRGSDEEGFGARRPFQGRQERSASGGFDRQTGRSFGPRNTYRREEGQSFRDRAPQQDAPRGQAAAAPRPMAAPVSRPVPVARLKEGVAQANRALAEVIEQFGSTLSGDYDISALEVMVSFSEDGRFLGFGQGGAATMTLSVTPLSAEEILEGEEGELMAMEDDDMGLEDDFAAHGDLQMEADLEVEEAFVEAAAPSKKGAGQKAAHAPTDTGSSEPAADH